MEYEMHYLRIFCLCIIIPAIPSVLCAQHVEVGAFGNYEHLDLPGLPSQAFGVGGRLDINLIRILQLELETAYDFKHPAFIITNTGSSVIVTTSKVGVLHGNVGLKLQSRSGSYFLFLKGGANRFDTEFRSTTASGFPTVTTLTEGTQNSFVKGVLYPGGGIGFHAGPLGIRVDVGDEIYWIHGAHNNFRVTFGPTLRF
jgi:hypothetical protein